MKYPDTAVYIKQARITLGLSASAFARLAFAASGSHVRQWERGEIRPGKAAMELIRQALENRS